MLVSYVIEAPPRAHYGWRWPHGWLRGREGDIVAAVRHPDTGAYQVAIVVGGVGTPRWGKA